MLSILEKAFFEGYATSDLDITTMFVCIGFTALISICICLVYKMVNRNNFFDRNFHLSLFALAVVTSAIILTIQSNIVVSLGMVGALSIVRFRTAIKNPMDLVFLFWSISVGIICGAGYAMIGVIASIVLTIGIVLFSVIPSEKESLILVVNAGAFIEDQITEIVSKNCRKWKICARSVNVGNLNLAFEIKTKTPQALVEQICGISNVTSASLIEHDGDVTV